MARKRRSLLGGKGSKLTAAPAPARVTPPKGPVGAAPADADPEVDPLDQPTVSNDIDDPPPPTELSADITPPADDDIEDHLETEVVTTRPRSPGEPVVVEDDEPMIGGDLTVPPPDEGDDAPAPPQEVVAHLHTRPADPEGATDGPPAAPTDDDLVLFDERPAEPSAVGPMVQFDIADGDDDDELPEPSPELLDPATALHSPTPPPHGGRIADKPPEAQADLPDDSPDAPPAPAEPQPQPAGGAFFNEEDGDPPTEEKPPGMQVEDFAAMYRAPMDVPDAPPMPGILGGETPPPVGGHERAKYQPVNGGGAPAAPEVTAPRGLWDETPLPNSGRAPGASDTPPAVAFRERAAPPVADDVPFYQDTWFIVAAGMAALAAIAVIIGVVFLGPGAAQEAPYVAPQRPAAPATARPPADLIPRDVLPEGSVLPDEDLDGAPIVQPGDQPSTTPVRRPDPAPTPQVRTNPTTPGATNRPAPQGAKTGRLKIRAEKQTLIYVNGKPVGMTPIDLDKPEGKYEISGEVDGQRRVERVELSPGTIRLVDF